MTDRMTPRADAPWRPAGTGMDVSFRCAECDRPSGHQGKRKVKTTRMGVAFACAACVEALKQRKAAR